MDAASTGTSSVPEALSELAFSDAGPLELFHRSRLNKLSKPRWRLVWLALHIDAWFIEGRKSDNRLPTERKRWRGAECLRLIRHAESSADLCSSAEDGGQPVEVVVQCYMKGGKSTDHRIRHRIRAETEEEAEWWCWALKGKIRPWTEVVTRCAGLPRPSTVFRLDGASLAGFCGPNYIEKSADVYQKLGTASSHFVDVAVPTLSAVNDISTVIGEAARPIPVAGSLLQFVSFGIKVASMALESEKDAQDCGAYITESGRDLIGALIRAMYAGDNASVNELIKFMDKYEECVRDFDCYVYLSRLGQTGRALLGSRPREILERLKKYDHLLGRLRVGSLESRVGRIEHAVASKRERRSGVEETEFVKISRLALQVPPTPQNLIFEMGNEDRPENKLKKILVGEEEIAGESACQRVVVGLEGLPGSGKSSVFVGIAKDEEVINCFGGKIMWIQSHQDREEAEMLDDLGHVAKLSGYDGRAVDRELESQKETKQKMKKIIKMAREAGRGKKYLIIVDNVWSPSMVEPFMSAAGDTGAVVFTTRKLDIFTDIGARRIKVEDLSEGLALRLLGKWSGKDVSVDEMPNAKIIVNDICGRLAMAVKISGATLGLRYRKWGKVIGQLRSELADARRPGGVDVSEHGTIYAMIAASYNMLEKRERQALRCFSVVGGRSIISINALRKMWCRELEEVERIAEVLGHSGLVEYVEDEKLGGGVMVHDVLVAFARRVCGDAESLHLHRLIVRRYKEALQDGGKNKYENGKGASNYYIHWWKSAPDGYFEHNILRHLEELGCSDEVVWTVIQENWQKYQKKNRNYASYRNDIERAIRLAEKAVGERKNTGTIWGKLRALGILFYVRMEGERSRNIEKAIELYVAVLEVITPESNPNAWAKTVRSLGTLYSIRIDGEKAENMEESIKCYKLCLQKHSREAYPYHWGTTMNKLGLAYSNRILGEKDQNMEEAIKCYRLCLEEHSRMPFPYEWGKTMNNLGLVYNNRTLGEKEENMEEAIKCFKLCLEEHSRKAYPYEWGTTMNNLGLAYSNRIAGEKAGNMEEAIICYRLCLEEHSREAYPYQWGKTMKNLGRAYTNRIVGQKAENMEEAIKCYGLCLEEHSRKAYPYDWSRTMNRLGLAYSNRVLGEKAENMEEAIKCYRLCLEERSRRDYPYKWGQTMNNLGLAYSNRIMGEKAENMEEAIKYYRLCLEEHSREAYPHDWSRTMNNLGLAYSNRIVGEKAKNIEEAIKCYRLCLEKFSGKSYPEAWIDAHLALGLVCAQRLNGDRRENLKEAIHYVECYLACDDDNQRKGYFGTILSDMQKEYKQLG